MTHYAPLVSIEALEEQLRQRVLGAQSTSDLRSRLPHLAIENPDFPLLAMEEVLMKERAIFSRAVADWAVVETGFNHVNTADMMDEIPDIKGFFSLSSGLPLIGLEIGDISNHPVFAVMFHDGWDFRGYVPRLGNVYNEKLMSAYGRNIASDTIHYFLNHAETKRLADLEDACFRLTTNRFHPLRFSMDLILEDLEHNIRPTSAIAA
jgi:hypothetical protein